MGCRQGARTVECMGIFPLAEVVRGHDWCWGQQDGQCTRCTYCIAGCFHGQYFCKFHGSASDCEIIFTKFNV